MKKYKCIQVSALGDIGDIITLNDNEHAKIRVRQGIIEEFKVTGPVETKVIEPSETKKRINRIRKRKS